MEDEESTLIIYYPEIFSVDILSEIFSFFPTIKLLSIFQFVSKSWYQIILTHPLIFKNFSSNDNLNDDDNDEEMGVGLGMIYENYEKMFEVIGDRYENFENVQMNDRMYIYIEYEMTHGKYENKYWGGCKILNMNKVTNEIMIKWKMKMVHMLRKCFPNVEKIIGWFLTLEIGKKYFKRLKWVEKIRPLKVKRYDLGIEELRSEMVLYISKGDYWRSTKYDKLKTPIKYCEIFEGDPMFLKNVNPKYLKDLTVSNEAYRSYISHSNDNTYTLDLVIYTMDCCNLRRLTFDSFLFDQHLDFSFFQKLEYLGFVNIDLSERFDVTVTTQQFKDINELKKLKSLYLKKVKGFPYQTIYSQSIVIIELCEIKDKIDFEKKIFKEIHISRCDNIRVNNCSNLEKINYDEEQNFSKGSVHFELDSCFNIKYLKVTCDVFRINDVKFVPLHDNILDIECKSFVIDSYTFLQNVQSIRMCYKAFNGINLKKLVPLSITDDIKDLIIDSRIDEIPILMKLTAFRNVDKLHLIHSFEEAKESLNLSQYVLPSVESLVLIDSFPFLSKAFPNIKILKFNFFNQTCGPFMSGLVIDTLNKIGNLVLCKHLTQFSLNFGEYIHYNYLLNIVNGCSDKFYDTLKEISDQLTDYTGIIFPSKGFLSFNNVKNLKLSILDIDVKHMVDYVFPKLDDFALFVIYETVDDERKENISEEGRKSLETFVENHKFKKYEKNDIYDDFDFDSDSNQNQLFNSDDDSD